MPREVITVHVGQCGNQIGGKFWETVLQEHAEYSRTGLYDECLSSLFRNVDTRTDPAQEILLYPPETGTGNSAVSTVARSVPIEHLRARAVLVDMEEGPVAAAGRGPWGPLFDKSHRITDVSGSGNNWAHGHEVYGAQYAEAILDSVRQSAELCDSLQSFFIFHSLGGGTGSGLGTYLVSLLADQFPEIYRFSAAVFPSLHDDVITSPYNSVLALRELIEHADCVLPFENHALQVICNSFQNKQGEGSSDQTQQSGTSRESPSLSPRYDFSRLSTYTNCLEILKSKQISVRRVRNNSSRRTSAVGAGRSGDRRNSKQSSGAARSSARKSSGSSPPFDDMNGIIAQVLSSFTSSMRFPGWLNVDLNEVIDADPMHDVFLSTGLLVRGAAEISDVNRNIKKLQSKFSTVHWNEDGFKVGLCSAPPLGRAYSILGLSNNCCIRFLLLVADSIGGFSDIDWASWATFVTTYMLGSDYLTPPHILVKINPVFSLRCQGRRFHA